MKELNRNKNRKRKRNKETRGVLDPLGGVDWKSGPNKHISPLTSGIVCVLH